LMIFRVPIYPDSYRDYTIVILLVFPKPHRSQRFCTEIHGVILCGHCVFLLCVLCGL